MKAAHCSIASNNSKRRGFEQTLANGQKARCAFHIFPLRKEHVVFFLDFLFFQ